MERVNVKERLEILILEDREEDAFLIERMLKKAGLKFNSRRVDTREEFIDGLESAALDVILSDHALPQFNSMEALKLTKAYNQHLPFILVTGTVSEEFAAESIKEGADDYVLKSNLSRLPSTIISSIKKRKSEMEKMEAEDALKKQNEELIKVNKELDSFVYSISHDLRAPLKSVLGLLNLCELEDKEPENVSEYLKRMRTSISRLDGILKEILDYSRNERLDVSWEKIDLKLLVYDCLEGLKYLDGSPQLELDLSIQNTREMDFYSDKSRIVLIINNLLSNAIKYQDVSKDKATLTIQISIDESVHILVRDNGIGIQEDQIPKVFDMFHRATEQSDGAGLGLYIVKEAIEKLQGTITVQSIVGKMTEFFIELPNQYLAATGKSVLTSEPSDQDDYLGTKSDL